MIEHTLSPEDLDWARRVAAARVGGVDPETSRFAYSDRQTPLGVHTNAAMAQLAAARVLNVDWAAKVNDFGASPNVGLWWNARWSGNLRRVKVADTAAPHWLHVHVTGLEPTYLIHGYVISGWVQANCPLEDFGGKGYSAHFTTNDRLTPIDPGFHDLHAWVNGWAGRTGFLCVLCGVVFEGEA